MWAWAAFIERIRHFTQMICSVRARAMHLLQAGIDVAVIALWLGHESIETTHIYVEADLAIKERALERIAPANSSVRRI
jgi:integrase